jgi:hypothetical protein
MGTLNHTTQIAALKTYQAWQGNERLAVTDGRR